MNARHSYLRWSLISSLVLAATLTGCVSDPGGEPVTPPVTNFKDIKTNDNFKWETTQSVTFQVTGLASPRAISKTLKVTSLDGNAVYFSRLQDVSASFSVTLKLPAAVTKVRVVYGSIVKDISIVNKTIKFDYITAVPAAQ
jgi:hypothetical protein